MPTLEPKTGLRPSLMVNLDETEAAPQKPRTLTEAVRVAVRTVDKKTLRRVACHTAGLAYQPQALLGLLTYCYARRLFGSEDIEDLMRRDADFRQLCQNEFPHARLLRRFRKENPQAVRFCLVAALRFLAEKQTEVGLGPPVEQAQLEAEASHRITMAIFIDRMALDED
ncbi:MAG TPA: transposase [Verrucomicrobiae bacterium]|nr:transposase [Verrucomicrobiae bacterium]